MKQYDKARAIYKKCYEIDPTYSKVYFQLFVSSVYEENKPKMLQYFDKLYHSIETEEERKDYNVYLLILNEYMPLREEYQKIIQNMNLEDILLSVDSVRYDDIEYQNQIRNCIYEKDFALALIKSRKEKTTFSIIVTKLCEKIGNSRQIEKYKNKIDKKVCKYVKSRNYEAVVNILELPENKIALEGVNIYFLELSKAILEIRISSKIPEGKNIDTQNIFEAISAFDYSLALSLANNYHQETESISSGLFVQILTDINEEIGKIKGLKDISVECEKSELEQYIDSQIEVLEKEKGIILLDPMTLQDRELIKRYIEKQSNVTIFSIGEEETRIVLRYIDNKLVNFNANEEMKKGKAAMRRHDYESSIQSNLKILSYRYFKPSKKTYRILGTLYLNCNYHKKALDYLIVATELNKLSYHSKDDFTSLIRTLQNKQNNNEEEKRYVEVGLEEFEQSNDFKIQRLKEIVTLVLEQNRNIDEVCVSLGMTEEEILIIKLEFARFSYIKGDINAGNQILKIVEQSKGKSKTVLNLLEEIRKKRDLYINKSVEDEKVNELVIPYYKKFKK